MNHSRSKPAGNRKATGKKTSSGKRHPRAASGKRSTGDIGYIKVIFFLIVAVVIGVAAFVWARNNTQTEGQTVNVYFLNAITKEIAPEARVVEPGSDAAVVERVLAELEAGPNATNLTKTIPNNVTIEEVTLPIGSEVAEVVFSESYHNLSDSDEIFCRVSLVWTLTELDFITHVRIFVGEDELLGANGEPMGLLNRDNVSISAEIPPDTVNQAVYQIYFSDDQGLNLVAEKRVIEVGSNQTAEKYIVEQIISGPTTPGLVATVPAETKINDVRTDESICYVDFNADFINKFVGGSTAEKMAVYSIVNSLTELPHIKKVQFFIDGNKVSDIQGHLMDISQPFERDEALILGQ